MRGFFLARMLFIRISAAPKGSFSRTTLMMEDRTAG
jgi:hypothetical protein